MGTNKFYVYKWLNKDTKEVVYIGKGSKDRYKSKSGRSHSMKNYLSENECEIRIVRYFDDEKEALALENRLLKKYKALNQAFLNRTSNGKAGRPLAKRERVDKVTIMILPQLKSLYLEYLGEKNKTMADDFEEYISEVLKDRIAAPKSKPQIVKLPDYNLDFIQTRFSKQMKEIYESLSEVDQDAFTSKLSAIKDLEDRFELSEESQKGTIKALLEEKYDSLIQEVCFGVDGLKR